MPVLHRRNRTRICWSEKLHSHWWNTTCRSRCSVNKRSCRSHHNCRQHSKLTNATYTSEHDSGTFCKFASAIGRFPNDVIHSFGNCRRKPKSRSSSFNKHRRSNTFEYPGRAYRIIQNNKLSLNPQLSVFTFMGTREPHVVRLFPTTTCSCPAKSHCYHIIAARMAIGFAGNNTTKRPLNLTQLRRNKRKRPDKTSGRKQPRILDEDVIPAPSDAEEVISAQRYYIPTHDNNVAPVPEEPEFREDVIPAPSDAEEVISAQRDDVPTHDNNIVAPVPEETEFREYVIPAPSDAEDIPTRDYPSVVPVREEPEFRDNICYSCSAAEPPCEKHQSSKHKKTHWIECDTCPRWYHNVCVNVSNRKRKYICDMCI